MANLKLNAPRIILICVFGTLLEGNFVVAQEPQNNSSAAEKLFTLKVLPVLKEKCFGCHGMDEKNIRGEYNLLTREGMLKGGESGDTSLVPGKPEESSLYQAVMWEGYEMPPKENDRLTKQETEYIRLWIKSGAPWPDESTQLAIKKLEWSVKENEEGIIVDNSGGLADDWTYRRYQPEDIWAFQPIKPTDLSRVIADNKNPIDYFVDQKLKRAELKPSPSADPRTLIRRICLDLTGLPPKPKEIESFLADWNRDSESAWKALVNRLLESDRYGERQAQHWLDIVRYADTAGFSNDYERSNAWRYRDYVIRSFNEDKPFDLFVKEQLAGDELRPGDPEGVVATGFLRMGPWGTAMIPKPEARQIYLDDLVHNVGQSFLAMPMRCCKCHDHKFDPIPTRDYYSMYAAFAATQPAEVPAKFLPVENRSGFEDKKKLVEELLAFARAELAKVNDKQEVAAKAWYAEHKLPYKDENARKNDPEDRKPPRHVGLTPEEKGIKKVREQDVWIWERRLERYQPLAQSVYNGPPPGWVNSRKLRKPGNVNRNWQPTSFILGGGALEAKLDRVQPGVLSATGVPTSPNSDSPPSDSPQTNAPWQITTKVDGRRLQLANWIANQKNPLTARVIVNRIWQTHFGKGLVKTANNFGAKGSKPTHPELLDWLAFDFMENGWKIKRLHRLIVTSKAYQRSGKPLEAKKQAALDPNNDLLATFSPRRLSAEELRDGILQTTGELNLEMGGVPIMPEINMEVALQPRMIQFSIAPAHQPSRTPAERNRRTIYAYRVRGQADPFLEIMNLPNPNESCELRESAAVTPQAFTLLNSDLMTDRSIAFALRIQKQTSATNEYIQSAIQMAYGRDATVDETKLLNDYFLKMKSYHQKNKPKPVPYPKQVIRSLVEEFTGEPFEFIEKLNVFENYVPDAKPWSVSAETRALADVCLLLLNSNEFVYVY